MKNVLFVVMALLPSAVWAAPDSLTFTTTGCVAGGACVCPASCTTATCALSGLVTCGGDITVNSGVTLTVQPWVSGSIAAGISISGTTTSGSNIVTGLANTHGLVVGQGITGAGFIPAATTITAVSATSITLSAVATASGAPTLNVVSLGFLTFFSGGTLTVASGAKVSADGAGYSGSFGVINGTCSTSVGVNGNGFGSGFGHGGACFQDGGGGGGYGGAGGNGDKDNTCASEQGAGGTTYDPDPNAVTIGSAGGAAGSADGDDGGTGPAGGGAILLYGNSIVVNGVVSAVGNDGGVIHKDAQGGGSGGGILLSATTAFSCNSGAVLNVQGGNAGWTDDKGGAGGGGRVKIFAASTSVNCTMDLAAGGVGCSGGDGSAAGVIDGSLLTAPTISAPTDCSFSSNLSPAITGTIGASACTGLSPAVTVSVDGTVLGSTSAINCATTPPSWSYSPTTSITGTVATGSTTISNVSNTSNLTVGETVTGTCIPAGTTITQTYPITLTGTTITNTSAVVTNVASVAGLSVGMAIGDVNFATGTTIASIGTNTITLSNPATASNAGETITAGPSNTFLVSNAATANATSEALTIAYDFTGGVHIVRAYASAFETTSQAFDINGDITNTSKVVINATTSQLLAGQAVSGTGIAAGTTIVSVNKFTGAAKTTNGSTVIIVADPTGWVQFATVTGAGIPTNTTISLVNSISLGNTHITKNTTTVSNTDTTGLAVGASVTGTNIPAGATVASVTNATTFVLSAAYTGNNTTSETLVVGGLTNTIQLSGAATATAAAATLTVGGLSGTFMITNAATTTTTNDVLSVSPLVISGNTHGTTTVDGIASTAALVTGQTVTGLNIPNATSIASIVNGTTITLSQAATGTQTGESLSIDGGTQTLQSASNAVHVYFDALAISTHTPAGADVKAALTQVTGVSSDSTEKLSLQYSTGATLDQTDASLTVSSSGTWTDSPNYTPSGQGTINIKATQLVPADASCASGYTATATASYIYDSVAPALSVSAPAFTSAVTVALTGSYSDATTGLTPAAGPASVTATVRDSACAVTSSTIAATTTGTIFSGTFTASPSTNALVDGTYCAVVTATDNAGNASSTAAPASTTFVIDRTNPAMTLNGLNTALQTVAAQDDSASGTATDTNLKNVVVAYCSMTGAQVCTATTTLCATAAVVNASFTPGTTFTETPSPTLADGNYCIIATATDKANNTTHLNELLTVDTGAPILTSFSVSPPLANTVPSTVSISGTYSDAGSGVDATSVTLNICAGDCTSSCAPVATVASTGTGFSAMPSGASVYTNGDGTYCAVVNFKDKAGNPQTGTKTFVLDTSAPLLGVAINSPTNTVAVAGTYSDTGTGLSAQPQVALCDASCTVCGGGFSCASVSGTLQSGTCAVIVPPPGSDGMYCVKETATDVAGNPAVATQPFLFVATPPAVTLNGAPQVLQNVPTASGNVGNVTPGDPVTVDVTYCLLGATDICNAAFIAACPTPVPFDSGPLALDASNNFSTTPTLPDGSYCVQADATDAAGNTQSVQETLTLDTETPALVINGAPNLVQKTSVVTGGVLNVLAGDPVSVDLVYCLLGVGDVCSAGFMTGCTPVNDSGALPLDGSNNFTNAPGPALADGNYCVQGTGTDAAQNKIAQTVTLTLDTTAPVVTLNGGPMLTQPGGTVTGTATDPDSPSVDVQYCTLSSGQTCADLVTCTVAYDSGALVPDGANAFSATPSPALADGTYCVQATAIDGPGNSSETQLTLVQAPGGGATGGASSGSSGGATGGATSGASGGATGGASGGTTGGASGGATGGTNSDGGSTSGTSADSGSSSGSSADSGSTSGSTSGSDGGAIGSSAGATAGATGGLINKENDNRLVGGGCSCHSTPSSGDLWLGAIIAAFLWRRRRGQ